MSYAIDYVNMEHLHVYIYIQQEIYSFSFQSLYQWH